jgi:hypothetical protein
MQSTVEIYIGIMPETRAYLDLSWVFWSAFLTIIWVLLSGHEYKCLARFENL